jgi:hypothetical protein
MKLQQDDRLEEMKSIPKGSTNEYKTFTRPDQPKQRCILKPDISAFYPENSLRARLYAETCKCQIETLAYYLERSTEEIETAAKELAETTTMTYMEAIDEVGRRILNSENLPDGHASIIPRRTEPKPKKNRAARRKEKRKKAKCHEMHG